MNPNEPLYIFLTKGVGIEKKFILMMIILFQFYLKQNKDFDPSKQMV
jgi:hypothetical protein